MKNRIVEGRGCPARIYRLSAVGVGFEIGTGAGSKTDIDKSALDEESCLLKTRGSQVKSAAVMANKQAPTLNQGQSSFSLSMLQPDLVKKWGQRPGIFVAFLEMAQLAALTHNQEDLLDYSVIKYNDTRSFTDTTAAGVAAIQRALGKAVTGVYDDSVRAQLQAMLEGSTAASA